MLYTVYLMCVHVFGFLDDSTHAHLKDKSSQIKQGKNQKKIKRPCDKSYKASCLYTFCLYLSLYLCLKCALGIAHPAEGRG